MVKVIIESYTNFMDLEDTVNECLKDIENLKDIKYSTTTYKDATGSDIIHSAMIIYEEE